MDMIPRNDYGERCQFDAYCKLVLYHEAIDYLREMQRRRDTVSYPYLYSVAAVPTCPQNKKNRGCSDTLRFFIRLFNF